MIKERVIQLVENKGLPKEIFYKKIGMTSANFRGKAKESPLNSNAIENILSEIRDVNAEWLITGKGEMLKLDNGNEQEKANSEEIIELQKKIIALQEENASLQKDNFKLKEENLKLKVALEEYTNATDIGKKTA